MSFNVLISCPIIHDDIDDFSALFDEYDISYDVPDVDQHLKEDELLEIINRYDGALIGDDEYTPQVFDRAERLEVVAKWGIGTDSIDFDAAEEHGVDIKNTPGAYSAEVANVAIAYIITLTRRLHEVDREVRKGNWHTPRGVSLAGRTLGIIGVGNIGSEVARRAAALGMDIVGASIWGISNELVEETGLEVVDTTEPVDAVEVCERSDILTIHCPHSESSHHLISKAELEALGPDGYVINTARGKVIDQEALIEALESGTIAGAGLDVFEEEPLSAESELTEFDNVILGSHNAQNTTEGVTRVHDRSVKNLLQGLGIDITLDEVTAYREGRA